MQIAEWLHEEGLSLHRAAQIVGAANGSVVLRHRNGTQIPDRERMRRYVIASGGRITPNDIYGLSDLIEKLRSRRTSRPGRSLQKQEAA